MKESNRPTIRAAAAVWLIITNRKKQKVGRVIDPTECICPDIASATERAGLKTYGQTATKSPS